MKLPSIQQVFEESTKTLRRFPVVIASAILGTAIALVLIDYEGPPGPTILFKILFAAILGIPLLLSVAVMAEKMKWERGLAFLSQAFAILLLIAYGYSVPSNLNGAPNMYLIRLLMLAAAMHFFVAIAPSMGAGGINGFWQYNKTLFLRVFTAFLFTCVLFVGLSLALAALDHLFGMNIPGKRYGELWVFLLGVFATWFFLGGVPREWESLEGLTDYPNALKIFAQYILLPLILVYLVILYAYLAKILIDWNWPDGWVGRLVLGYSGIGILSLLLLHPIRDHIENVWVKNMARWFYVVLIPLLVMLFLAQARRISEYGLTEGRYIGVAVTIWLGAISLYYIWRGQKNLKIIPASLCLLSLGLSFGPWGAFSVSERSQVQRLQRILTEDSILVNGSVHKAADTLTDKSSREISAILRYLHEIHGYEQIQPWFSENLGSDSTGQGDWYKDPATVAGMMGVEYINRSYDGSENAHTLSADQSIPINVQGYTRMVRSKNFYRFMPPKELSGHDVNFMLSRGMDILTISVPHSNTVWDSLQIDLRPFANALYKKYATASIDNVSPETLSLTASNELLNVKLCFQRLQLHNDGQEVKFLNYTVDILYTVIKEQ